MMCLPKFINSLMDSEIKKAVKILNAGGIIIYPSDTIWAIGCDATNENSVDKIYKIKNRHNSTPFICLMANYNMIKKYAYINQEIIDILEKIDEPTTVIYNDVKNLKTFSNSIGIRIPKDSFCYNLLSQFKKPIVSTSVNMSGDDFAVCFEDINKSILQEVDFAVNLRRNEKLVKASKIIKINKDNSITTIRS